jgi:hypothetical protein
MEIELKNKAIKCRSAKPVTSGRRVPASKLEMQGRIGKHAPTDVNKLITIRVAIIDSVLVRTV